MSKPGPKARPVIERFEEKVAPGENGCILWTASGNGAGYGAMYIAKGKRVLAHRWAYEHYVGPIPEGMVLDHLCRNRICVNPAHLEPVTHRTNVLRGVAPTAVNAAKTHCDQGHLFDAENTAMDRGKRACRACNRARSKAAYENNREALIEKSRNYYASHREQIIARVSQRRRDKRK